MVPYEKKVASIKKLIADYYNKTPSLQEVREQLDKFGLKGYLFGGVIRDLVASGPDATPRDHDVIVTGPIDNYIKFANDIDILQSGDWVPRAAAVARDPNQNSGGDSRMVYSIRGMSTDIWHISTQRGLFGQPEATQTIDRVPGTTFLTVESIVATFGPDADAIELHEDGFIETMSVAFNDMRPHLEGSVIPVNYAIKALRLSSTGIMMSPKLLEFVSRTLKSVTIGEFMEKFVARYGASEIPTGVLSAVHIGQDPKRLKEYTEYSVEWKECFARGVMPPAAEDFHAPRKELEA